jgi:fluoride exporter
MLRLLIICLGGAIGTGARYLVGQWASRAVDSSFPLGTLLVNVIGCFLIAAVMQLATSTPHISPELRLIVTTGFLGGFTTYSSFNYETTRLIQDRGFGAGATNLLVTVVGCLVAGVLGLYVASRLTQG